MAEAGAKHQAELAARDYAWKWFQYHASQRQTVFQFFLAIIGAVLAGYFALLHAEPRSDVARCFGFLIIALGFLFWRLDCRGARLVKIAERYLSIDENRLANVLGCDEIRLIAGADTDKGAYAWLEWAHSFRQIYKLIFGLIMLLGFVILLRPAA